MATFLLNSICRVLKTVPILVNDKYSAVVCVCVEEGEKGSFVRKTLRQKCIYPKRHFIRIPARPPSHFKVHLMHKYLSSGTRVGKLGSSVTRLGDFVAVLGYFLGLLVCQILAKVG